MSVAEADNLQAQEPEQALSAAFEAQRVASREQPYPSLATRRKNLNALMRVVNRRRDEIADAIRSDFGNRSRHESLVADVYMVVSSIKHMLKHLKRWMRPESRPIDLTFLPGRGKIVRQPLGVVGVIAPWNYPVQLSLVPLATALAAGNRVMLKPSELTPRTSELLADLLASIFPPDLVSVHTGGVDLGVAFSKLRFDHLLYTGSTHVGRLVMQEAAANLTPVTLELGGKSPVIVHKSYAVKKAAERIMSGKLFNAGQTCIAPDYILVHESKMEQLVSAMRQAVGRMYPSLTTNPDYTAIVNERHKARLEGYVADAEAKGARVVELNPAKESFEDVGTKLMPRIFMDVTDEMVLMQDEIFGPLLPVVPYRTLDEAMRYVNTRPRPLALYYFDEDADRQRRVLEHTTSGGVSINATILHAAQEELPFGGVGPSGMGAYHGKVGFDTLSHRKGVFYQAKLNASWLFNPPYGRRIEKLLDYLL